MSKSKIEQNHVILIVEDDEAIRQTLQFALELKGYKTFTAANGKIGVEMLHNIPKPCLIFLDLMMPVMNGWEFVETIEKDETLAKIPVVAITAFTGPSKTIRVKSIIQKPIDLESLYRATTFWCGGECHETG